MADLRVGILLLRPSESLRYRGCPATHLHGAFTHIVADGHAANERRPYCLGPLASKDGRSVNEGDQCRPDDLYGVRVGIAGAGYSDKLTGHIGAKRDLDLGKRLWHTEGWLPEEDADELTCEELCASARVSARLSLELLSPTWWNLHASKSCLLPHPARIFRGLTEIWEKLQTDGLPPLQSANVDTITDQVNRAVRVTDLQLDTAELTVRRGQKPQAGVIGTIDMEFTALREAPDLLRDLCLLLELARYVGVGKSASFGFGQARPAGK